MTISKGKSFWIKETPSGRTEYRVRTKVLFTLVPLVLAGFVYLALMGIGALDSGADIIVVLAYGAIVLMGALILLVIFIALAEYLGRFE